jgi:hypothetical protein
MRQDAPTTTTPPSGAVSQQDGELIYSPDERTWTAGVGMDWQQAPAAATPRAAAQVSIFTLLRDAPPESVDEVRRRIAKLDRADLIERYRTAFADCKLLAAYFIADELIERGIPPCFWHATLALDSANVAQRRILTIGDMAWLRRWSATHAKAVRYKRGKALLTGSEAVFLREADYAFYDGKRPAWALVKSLSMNERQQFDSAYLRTTPIKKQAAATEAMSKGVLDALRDNLSKTRRVSFGLAEALASADRQHALWLCSRMVKDGSPTQIALRYEQKTGKPIPRWTAAK